MSIEEINKARQVVIVALEQVLEQQREVAQAGGDALAIVRVIENRLNELDGGVR
jgi:hypothetical protein